MSRLSEFKPVAPEPGRPLFQAVRDAIRSQIDSGQYPPGAQLPSTKVLSKQINVSLVTVHRALHELVASGVLRRGQGRGTFVHESYMDRTAPAPGATSQATLSGLRIGLVFHEECSLADFYHGHVLEGVRRGALTYHADLVILRFGEDFRRECQGFIYVNPMRQQLSSMPWFDGQNGQNALNGTGVSPALAATSGSAPSAARARLRAAKRPPVMVVGASFDHDHTHALDCDNADLAEQAVAHLYALGHRRIGYLGGSAEVCNNIDRWRGFQQACASRRLVIDERAVMRVPGWRLNETQRAELARRWANMGDARPTAVFGAGYYFALDAYSLAAELGLRVPNELSIVGVDDPPSAEHLMPSMTTLAQPLEQMGRLAAKGLVDLLVDQDSYPKLVRLRADLVVRKSSGPAPGATPST